MQWLIKSCDDFFEEKGQTNGVEDYLLASYFVVKLTVGFREFLISHGKFKALLFKLESPVQVFVNSVQCCKEGANPERNCFNHSWCKSVLFCKVKI